MSTSGAIAGQAFNFNYSFVSSADPTLFHTTVLATTDITIYQRTGGSTSSAGNPVTAPTVSGNVHTISLTAGEMTGDEVVLDISSAGMVSEVISISLEPAQADVIKISNDATAADNLELQYDGTGLTGNNFPAKQVDLATVDTNVDAILVDTGTTLPASIATIDTNVDAILVDTGTTIPGTIATVDANVDSILVDTGTTLPAQISGLETKVDTVDANVDAVLVDTGTTIPGTIATVDANVDAILVDTGTTLPATLSTIEGKVDAVDAVADLIKVDTAAILADTGTDGVVISTAQAQAIADEILKRSVGNVEGATLAEHSLATIVLAILESSRSGSTWTIKRTDGSTTQATKTLTLDNAADPVVGVD